MRGFQTDLLQRTLPLGAAVSGGADSVAMLHLLLETGLRPTVLHVNYGFRGEESEADQQFVSQIALGLGLKFLSIRPASAAGNREQAARRARYEWFRNLMQTGLLGQVATAHTADDQAETVLFRFLRGSGTAGLAAIRPEVKGVVRPLLGAKRADLRGYLTARGIPWREDSSNRALTFRRNRIRHELLPALTEQWNPNLPANLAQTALWAQAEEEYWHGELPRLMQNWVRFTEHCVEFEAAALKTLPLAASRRVVRHALEQVQGDLHGFTFAQGERVLDLAFRQEGNGSFRTAKWQAQRSGGCLRITSLIPQNAGFSHPITVPGTFPLPNQRVAVHLELKPGANVYNDVGQQADWALISGALQSGSLELRNWQPGDRFRQAGQATDRKLKRFFQEAGIPSWQRFGWPVITCANTMLWTRGQGVSPQFRPSACTGQVLQILEVPDETPNQKL